MAVVSRDQIKSWFRKGLKPLEVHFASWIDSFWHKNDAIPMSSIDGLNEALNQRTITIDEALSDESENPVQNKIITAAIEDKADTSHTHTISEIPRLQEELSEKAYKDTTDDLQRQIDLLAQSGTEEKEVVAVATYSDLEAIEEPSQEVIYKTLDTNKLYLYNGEDFEDVTGRPVDNTIYVNDIAELFSTPEYEGMYSVLCVTTSGGGTSVSATYTLTITGTSRMLQNREGWAECVSVNGAYQWMWHRYSYEGHTHQELVHAATRAYTLDFGTGAELIQDVNMLGSVTINRLVVLNVERLYVTYGTVSHQLIDLTQPVSLNVADGQIITWEIERTIDDGLACVGVRCSINS